MTTIVFNGPYNAYFNKAFFPPWGGPVKVDVLSTSPTQYIVVQPKTGIVTTFDGTGFTYDGDGYPIGGTFTGMTFAKDGATIATWGGIDWDMADFQAALDASGAGDDTQLDAILGSEKIKIDAGGASVGLKQNLSFADKKVDISGSDHDDWAKVGTGNDKFAGGQGADTVFGDSGKDYLKGDAGRDKLVGGGGDDRLFGGNQADILRGGFGNDFLNGGQGRDIVDGGGGDDYLVGGGGADVFVFGKNFGIDWVEDFEDGVDLINLKRLGIGYDDLTINQVGSNETEIGYGSDLIILLNVVPAEISAADFLFA
jgi:Ca2+-binding RTX toxin-like protein